MAAFVVQSRNSTHAFLPWNSSGRDVMEALGICSNLNLTMERYDH